MMSDTHKLYDECDEEKDEESRLGPTTWTPTPDSQFIVHRLASNRAVSVSADKQ